MIEYEKKSNDRGGGQIYLSPEHADFHANRTDRSPPGRHGYRRQRLFSAVGLTSGKS